MNVLQLLSVSGIGGTETFSMELVKGLIARGHRAMLVNTWTDSKLNAFAQKGLSECKKQAGDIPFVALRGGRRMLGPRWVREVRRFLKGHDFDLVNTYGTRISLGLRLIQRSCGLRHHVLGVRGLDQRRHRLDCALDRRTEHLLDLIVCNAQAVAKRRRQLVHTPEDRLRVIPNGIDLSRFHPDVAPADRASLGLPPGFLFVHVGSFRAEKDHTTLLEAMRGGGDALRSAHLVLVGDGAGRKQVTATVRRWGLGDRVSFVGARSDVAPLIKTCDAFVLSSYSEGMPRAVMEAMALGMPVVTTDAGGIQEIAEHERNALVVPVRCPKALAQAMIRIITEDGLGTRLGRAAAQRMRKDFDIEIMIDRYVELYERILSGRIHDHD